MIEPTRYRGRVTRVDSTGTWVGRYQIEGSGFIVGDLVKFELCATSTGERGIPVDSKLWESFASVNMELSGGSGWSGEDRLPSEYPMGGGSRSWQP